MIYSENKFWFTTLCLSFCPYLVQASPSVGLMFSFWDVFFIFILPLIFGAVWLILVAVVFIRSLLKPEPLHVAWFIMGWVLAGLAGLWFLFFMAVENTTHQLEWFLVCSPLLIPAFGMTIWTFRRSNQSLAKPKQDTDTLDDGQA